MFNNKERSVQERSFPKPTAMCMAFAPQWTLSKCTCYTYFE